ncbi:MULTISPECIES: hypothetical protein [unclassified Streptomyces]|uniref:hypothetical protein n=1 Tax=unclassified Streptomyces TaxID=2593676 RepID=UPI00073CA92F|nr:hypothetical protein [Streptomyces sp. AVP053U2]ODA70469.1 hypothetical protein APS67_005338 [Streptomyces sp. AVP053U2]
MDLTAALLRLASARPRVLLVTTPGGTAVRLAAESELRLRGWPPASTPAGADLMVVAGRDCSRLQSALERLWQDMPQPRARVWATTPGEVPSLLDAGRARLGTPDRRRADARRATRENGHREDDPDGGGPGEEHENGDTRHEGHDQDHAGHRDSPDASEQGGRGRADHDEHDGHDGHDGHAGHGGGHGGQGGEGMEMPGGLPMAERGEDRDGLTLDRLHLPLGPFLADWPAGLTLRVVLQGDVVQRADLDEPPTGRPADPFWSRPWSRAAAGEPVSTGQAARRRAAAHLDSLGRLLSVVGWPAEAVTAGRLRDDLLEEAPAPVVLPRVERFARRVGRSRTLYWLTRGVGLLSAVDARAAGVTGPAARADGDVPARYRQWLTDVVDDVRQLDGTAPLDPAVRESPRGRWDAGRPPSAALAELLPRLLVGAELGAARLVVASLDPDPDELAGRPAEVVRG